VLKGVDEVVLLLEDLGLNLQSMMASPYVRPFSEDVRQWEQKLSLISEAIEVWMLVQRKWMYLESIFIGNDDIRQQLPQEAKRFDTIDRCVCVCVCVRVCGGGSVSGAWDWALYCRCCSCDLLSPMSASTPPHTHTHRAWQSIMTDTSKNTLVLDACSAEGRYALCMWWCCMWCCTTPLSPAPSTTQ